MLNLTEFVLKKCRYYGDKTLLKTEEGATISYLDFANETKKASEWLDTKLGIIENLNFSIIAPNCPQYLFFLFALIGKNNRAVNLNPNLNAFELDKRLESSSTQIIITTKEIYETTLQFNCKVSVPIILLINPFETKVDKVIVRKNISIPHGESPQSIDIAFLQFTGGTTGIVKAATISHENILSNIAQLSKHFKKYRTLENTSVLIAFPFYHIFSIVFNFLFFLNNGGKCILYKNLRDTELIVKLIEENEVNFTVGVNTWYKKLMANERFIKLKYKGVLTSIAGGEFVPQSTKDAWLKLMDTNLYSGYGLTETSSLVIISPLDASDVKNSIGVAIPETTVQLLDENNKIVNQDNVQGELLLKGPQVTKSYYNNPKETALAFHEGWFKTGDIAIRKSKGHFQILDRKKDMISISGNKVYPNEVEEVILQLEGILDVAAVGLKSKETGEKLVVCVSANQKIVAETVIEHCQKYLSRFKIPKQVIQLKELPKTAIGKTNRKELRELINQIA